MKQVVQGIGKGKLQVAELPLPAVQSGSVLIANRRSLISSGTERMARELARKSLLAKARARPDHVRRVLEKMRSEGVWSTLQQVRRGLDEPMSMGYCSAGIVLACGSDVRAFKPGDHVASNGPHAEVVCVPKNLCARIPDQVDFDQAAFAILGAIAMQGLRLSKVMLGETVFVIGLGLVGQLTVALLKAAGATVIGTDLDETKCELAKKMGALEARPGIRASQVEALTGGLGADAVVITASTKSNAPIDLAANAVRQKGRVVLVGVVGLELDRRPFYFKEAEFVVSCSYGPGRYDPKYEQAGHDYPAAHVRWTEQRNMQAVLDMMASGRLDVRPLISHRFPIDLADKAYELMEEGRDPYLGILLDYPEHQASYLSRTINLKSQPASGNIQVGCLGAGSFARGVLLPKLSKLPGVDLHTLCSAGGMSAVHTGRKLGFARATSDEDEVLADEQINTLFIVTRHDLHAAQVIRAVEHGKSVFVEKPLCLTARELIDIERTLLGDERGDKPVWPEQTGQSLVGHRSPEPVARTPFFGTLMVGFNRRFAPATRAVRAFFARTLAPLTISIRFNAGAVPEEHWVQDERVGGGRIIGEACHAIDLATFLTGSPVCRVFAESIGGPCAPPITDDQCFLTLRHANGSISNVAYLAGGDKAFPKERVEVIGGGRVGVIDDFRRAEGWHNGRRAVLWRGSQDKGHCSALETFVAAVSRGGDAPIPWEEIRATTLASILAVQSIRHGCAFDVSANSFRHDEAATVRDELADVA